MNYTTIETMSDLYDILGYSIFLSEDLEQEHKEISYLIFEEFLTVAKDNLIHGNYLGITKIIEKGDPDWDDNNDDD